MAESIFSYAQSFPRKPFRTSSLLDKLLEKKVITDSEWESADEMQNKRDKARFVIDTVRKKGEAASSEMIEFLCETDPFLCEHLGLL
uniref:CARD domain-containing protein n=1 Tax=Seriola lalandi dorsalis TaxID=1841481 RepID=A0A3B4WYT7_SERLL